MKNPTGNGTTRNRKMSLRLTEDENDRLNYYSEKWDMSKTDLLLVSFEHYIRWVNSDYDLPRAETRRMNELVDIMNRMVVSQQNLEKSTVSGFETLIGLNRGDNYLIDDYKEDV